METTIAVQKDFIVCPICLEEKEINNDFFMCVICNDSNVCDLCYKKSRINRGYYNHNVKCPLCRNEFSTDIGISMAFCLSKINDKDCVIQVYYYLKLINIYINQGFFDVLKNLKEINKICIAAIYKKNFVNKTLYNIYADNCIKIYNKDKDERFYEEAIKIYNISILKFNSVFALANIIKIYEKKSDYHSMNKLLDDEKIRKIYLENEDQFSDSIKMHFIELIAEKNEKDAFDILKSIYHRNEKNASIKLSFMYARYLFKGIGNKGSIDGAFRAIEPHLKTLTVEQKEEILKMIF